MNPLNRMNPGSYVSCTCVPNDEGVLKCNGHHTAPLYESTPKHYPYAGNGYGAAINPLLEEPETIDEHVALIRARGASLERWTRKHEAIASSGPIIRELIARMEGNLQQLRTLVKDIEKAEKLARVSAEALDKIADAKPTAFENLCETMPELAEHVRSIGKAESE